MITLGTLTLILISIIWILLSIYSLKDINRNELTKYVFFTNFVFIILSIGIALLFGIIYLIENINWSLIII